jgi:methionine synthase II (cobalamin-independent)
VLEPGAGELEFADIGIRDVVLASHREFARLKADGVIAPGTRFQAGIATPCSPALVLMERDSRPAIEPAYERQVLREVAEICATIPHDELAIQWDVCFEVGIWSGDFPAYFDDVQGGVVARIARAVEAVPESVEVGIHLCYGDFGHEHYVQPDDLGVVTDMANAVTETIERPLTWIHMPVPMRRDDKAYFAPLRGLTAPGETELYLGLVHMTDGVEGATRRARAARTVVDAFGVATECGFGRRPPETVRPLLDLHVEIATALGLA